MDGGLGRAVGGRRGERDKRQAGGDVEDGRAGLLQQVRHQRGGDADGAEQVGVDDRLGVGGLALLEVFGAHDAGVVEQHIERGESGGQLVDHAGDAGGIFDVEDDGLDAGIGGGDGVERALPAAGDDDLVAQLVQRLGQRLADAGTAAGKEDSVAGELHEGSFSRSGIQGFSSLRRIDEATATVDEWKMRKIRA